MATTQLRTPSPLPALGLPPGRWHGRLWVSDEPLDAPDRYLACVAAHPSSGLWPVLIPRDLRFERCGADWVADRHWLPPAGHRIDGIDVGAALAGWWQPPCCDGACLDPFDTEFPGLARKATLRADPLAEAGNTGSVLAAQGGSRLGLVRARRPADIPALIGWTVPPRADHPSGADVPRQSSRERPAGHRPRQPGPGWGHRPWPGVVDPVDQAAAISAVLRSWADRFGAVLLSLGSAELELSVAAPPRTRERALLLAAEQRAFCLARFDGQPGSLRELAGTLVGTRLWRFWWD